MQWIAEFMQHQFRVKKSERGKRLDSFIYEKLGDWSHKRVKQLIDKKKVFINGKSVFISSWNLKPNDKVQFTADESDAVQAPETGRYQFVQVIFEDTYILVTHKPAFVDYDSFVTQVAGYLKRMHQKKFYPYLGQVHRLDKETSGILLFTKKKMANTLADQFRERTVKKQYVAVVRGRVRKEHDVIEERLEKKKFDGGKKVQVVKGNLGKESYTEYWVEERYDEGTLLKVLIGTGRTHQIRVHMADIGHPIWGDKLYGDEEPNPDSKVKVKMKRQALHAHRIEFKHPVTGKRMQFEAPIPPDMSALIDALRESV